MKVSEAPIDPGQFQELTEFADDIFRKLGSNLRSPANVVDEAVYRWQQTGVPPLPFEDPNDGVYAFGMIWGNAIVSEHGWRWAELSFHEHNDWKGMAVVSQDASLAILPFAHIHECLSGNDEVKIGAAMSAIDVPPVLSSRSIWSPIPQSKEIGREEAFFRRADHRLPA